MSRIKKVLQANRDAMQTKSAKVGGYSFIISVVMLAIIVAVNVLAASLPAKFTQFDISATRLYSVTSATKVVAQNLNKEVKIYWICQAGKEDSIVSKLLDIYDGLSDNITVVKKDPDVFPTFAQQYTEETVSNNSLVVECGDTYRYIPYTDLYEYDTSSYYSYYQSQSVATAFDGEGVITAAIDYVVSDDLPIIYSLTGHGEAELSDTAVKTIEKANYVVGDFSLLTTDEIPDTVDAVLINSPTSDISEEEAQMLLDYLANGGKLMVFSGPQDQEPMTNLHSVLEQYGVTYNDGIVIEGDRNHYAFSQPYILLPDIQSSVMTDELVDNKSYIIVAIASGLTVNSSSATSLLNSSADSFSKIAGYDITTTEKEEGDIDGDFSLAVSIEGTNNEKIVWVSSDYILDDTYNAYSSGANIDFTMNSVAWLIGDTDSISIRSKSLEYNYLTINETSASKIKVWMIGLAPAFYLCYGIITVVSRRKSK